MFVCMLAAYCLEDIFRNCNHLYLILFILAFSFATIMSLPLFERLPWSSCFNPISYQFPLRVADHDLEHFEDTILYSRVVSPRLKCYKLNIQGIELTLKESSAICRSVPDTKAHSNIMSILLTYRIFDVMNQTDVNPRYHPRIPFNFNHKCVRRAVFLLTMLTHFSVSWNERLDQCRFECL